MSTSDYEEILLEYFGFEEFRDNQREIIKTIINYKRDVCATMFTGAGKSMCYQFPAVYLEKTVIVVSPLISLMNDQMMKMNELNIPSICLNSTVTGKALEQQRILNGAYRIVYTTPEYIIRRRKDLSHHFQPEPVEAT